MQQKETDLVVRPFSTRESRPPNQIPFPRRERVERDREVPSIVHEVLRSPGRPLDPDSLAFMQPRFGHDFSGVRVHTGAKAEESSKAVRMHWPTRWGGMWSLEQGNTRRIPRKAVDGARIDARRATAGCPRPSSADQLTRTHTTARSRRKPLKVPNTFSPWIGRGCNLVYPSRPQFFSADDLPCRSRRGWVHDDGETANGSVLATNLPSAYDSRHCRGGSLFRRTAQLAVEGLLSVSTLIFRALAGTQPLVDDEPLREPVPSAARHMQDQPARNLLAGTPPPVPDGDLNR